MSITDNIFSVILEPINTSKTTLKQCWWHIMDNWKVGIAPLPLFLLAEGLIALDCLGGRLPSDIVVMVATLALFGFAYDEFGKRLLMPGKLSMAIICTTLIPSALAHYGLLPDVVVEPTIKFYKSIDILCLYICCTIVGSIMSTNRTTLIQGSLKIFLPTLCGEVVGMLVGIGVGTLLGMEPFQAFFFIVLPTMTGGVGEGAIPLSMGYAALVHMEQGVALGRISSMVMPGGLMAIVISGCLSRLGKHSPHLTGGGQLMPNRSNETRSLGENGGVSGKADVGALASGALLAVPLCMMGVLGHKLIGLPAPVGMLFLAMLLKLTNVVSPRLQEGSQMVYKLSHTAVTYPILLAAGVAITLWQELVSVFTLTNLLVIVSIVSALAATGFFAGKKTGIHPTDVAIVSRCQSGQGGTGDVAILTAGSRISLMPLVQIATHIDEAVNVSLGLSSLSHYLV